MAIRDTERKMLYGHTESTMHIEFEMGRCVLTKVLESHNEDGVLIMRSYTTIEFTPEEFVLFSNALNEAIREDVAKFKASQIHTEEDKKDDTES